MALSLFGSANVVCPDHVERTFEHRVSPSRLGKGASGKRLQSNRCVGGKDCTNHPPKTCGGKGKVETVRLDIESRKKSDYPQG